MYMLSALRTARLLMLGAVSAAAILSAPAAGAPRLRDARAEKLEGTWRQTHSEFDGQDATGRERQFQNHWVITANAITIYTNGASSGGWTYCLNAAKGPAQIDL